MITIDIKEVVHNNEEAIEATVTAITFDTSLSAHGLESVSHLIGKTLGIVLCDLLSSQTGEFIKVHWPEA